MIELDKTVFSYRPKGHPALREMSATIAPGVHLLAGENGAGKTTLLHILAGAAFPTSGRCLIDGKDASTDNPMEKGKVFLLEENMFFPGKSIRDFATMHSRFYPLFSNDQFEENLRAFGLSGHETMKSLSMGNLKKAQLAYALALGTDVLLLDEPTNALDIDSREILRRRLIQTLREDQTVIVSTHTVSEFANIFDGAIILRASTLQYAGTGDEVAEVLSFRITDRPLDDTLYSENHFGRIQGIYKAGDEPTDVDWLLLYRALHSDRRDTIMALLNYSKSLKNGN